MMIAQQLYEGIDMGDGETVGLITYMRTDSVNISKDATEKVRHFIKSNFGDKYLPKTPNKYKSSKSSMVEANQKNVVTAAKDQEQLAAAILDRLYETLRKNDISLVVQSIPTSHLRDAFPVDDFDTERPGMAYLPAKPLLEPLVGKTPLYNMRSHGHWTAVAHELSGKALADLIIREELLPRR